MGVTAFNPLDAAQDLETAGIESDHAVAMAKMVHQAVTADDPKLEKLATKDDLNALKVEVKAEFKNDLNALKVDIRSLEARMYRALWIQGGAIVAAVGTIVGILAALRFLPVSS